MSVSRPPEVIDAGPLLLRRSSAADADAVAAAVGDSLPELVAWMPWAGPVAAQPATQRARAVESTAAWDSGSSFEFVMVEPATIRVVGVTALHRRIDEGGLEIGYWVRSDATGRGYATAAARALTNAGLALADVTHVEIHCDEANTRSAAVPRRLGYRLVRVDEREPTASAETLRLQIWRTP